mgnify:FL=1
MTGPCSFVCLYASIYIVFVKEKNLICQLFNDWNNSSTKKKKGQMYIICVCIVKWVPREVDPFSKVSFGMNS